MRGQGWTALLPYTAAAAWLCYLLLTLCHHPVAFSAAASEAASGSLSRTSGRALSGTSASPLTVTVVNDIPSHFEVLAGVIQVLKALDVRPHVIFTGSPKILTNTGFIDWVGSVRTSYESYLDYSHSTKADVIVCISPEMGTKVCADVLATLQPRLFLAYVHRADTATPSAKILSTLASTRLRHALGWSLPVASYSRPPSCPDLSCLRGFSIQGALRKYKSKAAAGFTRNYTRLWERLVQLRAEAIAGGAMPAHVVVVGKGRREDLEIPAEIDGDVEFYSRLPYNVRVCGVGGLGSRAGVWIQGWGFWIQGWGFVLRAGCFGSRAGCFGSRAVFLDPGFWGAHALDPPT